MIEINIGVFSPVTELGKDIKMAPFYGGMEIRTIEQEPNLELSGSHYSRHKETYPPKSIFLLEKYLPFINRFHRVSVKNVLLEHVKNCDIIVIEYTQLKYLTIEQCKVLQDSIVLFDDVDEAYDEDVLLGEFKTLLENNNIDSSNFGKISNQDLNFWCLNRVAVSSNIQYLGTDDFSKLYSDKHIIKQFKNIKTKNFISCLGSPQQQYRMDFIKFCIENNIDDNFISIGHAPMLSPLRTVDTEEKKQLADKYQIEEYDVEYFFKPNKWKTTVYKDSYFTVVPETAYQGKLDCTFDYLVTEKTYNPIVYGHPFIHFAPVGNCDYLKDLGFELFEEIHDPYDNRFDSICSSILDFDSDCITDETLEKCIHNSNNMYSTEFILSEWEQFLSKYLT